MNFRRMKKKKELNCKCLQHEYGAFVCAFTWLQLVHHAVYARIALFPRKSIVSGHREANRQVPYPI